MNMIWPYDVQERMYPKFSDICLAVEENPRKIFNLEIDPTRDRTEPGPAGWETITLPLGHSYGGFGVQLLDFIVANLK